MKYKTILKISLITSIISILFFGTVNCELLGLHRDYLHKVTYIYKNRTGVDLVMEVYNEKNEKFKSFSIENGGEVETHKFEFEGAIPFFFEQEIDLVGVYIILRFKDNGCVKYTENNSKVFTVEEYENYDSGRDKGGRYTLYYTFTKEDDYDIAEECE